MRYTVDRIEETLAVLETEDREMLTIPAAKLPEGVKEGDVLLRREDGFFPDPEEQAVRAARIRKKMDALWK